MYQRWWYCLQINKTSCYTSSLWTHTINRHFYIVDTFSLLRTAPYGTRLAGCWLNTHRACSFVHSLSWYTYRYQIRSDTTTCTSSSSSPARKPLHTFFGLVLGDNNWHHGQEGQNNTIEWEAGQGLAKSYNARITWMSNVCTYATLLSQHKKQTAVAYSAFTQSALEIIGYKHSYYADVGTRFTYKQKAA